ncbi:LysR family transcriptional regulator [Domibacillus epiphyticus]|uniref:LysR family transcriptional regulator n=1 Tax=Domibacillus epiphyticus TaxID=1714355 RepID=A0A1V2ABQ8_9BACI|nr:LysR family transcriptional regulator [Domibacillus epiphyticus]OMP68397.1 LysR family transcriptional regulator [Domibacillus epiphyticus]
MDIKWLQTFIKAAELENFRMASEELYVTQPAVTKHIQRLEDYLNIQLFERIGKSIKLTPAGHKFLPLAKEITASFERNMNAFDLWKQGYNKKLNIACAPQIASSFLPDLLSQFISTYPHIEVDIDILKSYEIAEKVSTGAVDLGLARMPSVHTNVMCSTIHEESVVLAGPITDTAEESSLLTKYRVFTNNHPGYWKALLKELKGSNPYIKTMAVSQIEVTKRFIETGLGISYLPESMVKEEIAAKKLKIYPSSIAASLRSVTYLIEKIETEETMLFKEFVMVYKKRS